MKDYSDIKKYPVGPWDIGLWFELFTLYAIDEEPDVYVCFLVDISDTTYIFKTKNNKHICRYKSSPDICIKRLSPQPKFEPYENEFCNEFTKTPVEGRSIWLKYFTPFSFKDSIDIPFNKWLEENETETIKENCPFWLDKEFWGGLNE